MRDSPAKSTNWNQIANILFFPSVTVGPPARGMICARGAGGGRWNSSRSGIAAQVSEFADIWDSKLHGFLPAARYEHFSKLSAGWRRRNAAVVGEIVRYGESGERRFQAVAGKHVGLFVRWMPEGPPAGPIRVLEKDWISRPFGVQRATGRARIESDCGQRRDCAFRANGLRDWVPARARWEFAGGGAGCGWKRLCWCDGGVEITTDDADFDGAGAGGFIGCTWKADLRGPPGSERGIFLAESGLGRRTLGAILQRLFRTPGPMLARIVGRRG